MKSENNTPENNVNTPQVGPMPEPLPPEPVPPAPVVPEPTPAPTPAPEPTPESTPTPTPEPTPTESTPTQTAPTPEQPKPKKESNKNNYILAGVSIGVIAVIAILIAGGLLGWFGEGFLGGSLFGGSSSGGGSGNGGSGLDASIMDFVAGKAQENDHSDAEADATNEESLQVLKSALIKYQTNNMGNLPPIDESGHEYLYKKSTSETTLIAFYNDYLGDDFVDKWGYKPSVEFYANPDEYYFYEVGGYDEDDDDVYASLRYDSTITVFYNATCDANGKFEPSSNSRSFAITIGKSDYSGYYCVSNN